MRYRGLLLILISACAGAAAPAPEPLTEAPADTHRAAWCAVDGDCSGHGFCVLGVCERREVEESVTWRNPVLPPAQWNDQPCWLAHENRILPSLATHAGCQTRDESIIKCRERDAPSCFGAGRLLESGDERDESVRYYARACKLGFSEGCKAVNRLQE